MPRARPSWIISEASEAPLSASYRRLHQTARRLTGTPAPRVSHASPVSQASHRHMSHRLLVSARRL